MQAADVQQRNRILGVLFFGVLMAALDIAIVGPALPVLQAAFVVDESALGWVFSIYVLGNLVGTPFMAALSDRFGRRSIYVLSLSGFALGSLLVAAAPGFAVLLLGRAVQGLAAGGIFPVASAVIGDTFPADQRGRALGLIGAVFGLAFLIGPILGGVLLLLSWHWLFLINIPLAALLIVAGWRVLPATRPAQVAPFDWPGTLVLGVLLAALAYALTELGGAGGAAPQVVLSGLAALLLVPVFIVIERRAAQPVLQPALLTAPQIVLVSLLAIGAGIAEASIVFVPSLLTLAYGVSASTASYLLLVTVLAMAVGSPLAGRLLDRIGARPVVVGGTVLTGAGLLVLGGFPTNMPLFVVASTLFGLGLAILLGSALRYILLNEARVEDRAAAQGLLTLTMGIGQLLGAVLVVAVATAAGAAGALAGYAAAFSVIGAAMLALTVPALALRGRAATDVTAR